MNIEDITLSFSSLKQFSKSPAHFVGYKNKVFKQSAPMRRGWLTHLLTLEPEKAKDLTILDVSTRANKKYKEAVAENDKGEQGVFTAKEVIDAKILSNAVMQHPLASKLINEAIVVEKHLKWSMPTGFNNEKPVKFHGFADIIGQDYIADLKVTDNEPKKMQRWVLDNLYHMQIALYKEAVWNGNAYMYSHITEDLDIKKKAFKCYPKCYLITVDPNSPHGVVVYQLSDEMVKEGLKIAELEINLFAQWFEAWNGDDKNVKSYDFYEDDEAMILDLPSWYK
tara:strand:+ start:661 stop:1503 length:843 start_codon:yes stop_codon:yes gene_type:complete